jgi:hypothetical protein
VAPPVDAVQEEVARLAGILDRPLKQSLLTQ